MRIELSANSRDRNYAAGRQPAPPRHVLEQILAWRLTRRGLRAMTRLDSTGTCFFERACVHYNNPGLSGRGRSKWRLLELVIDCALKRARLDKEFMTEKLFHHQPTVRALALAGRSIARYGLAAPQRFSAPLMVVWNLTQACNLRCRHCYQNATPRPAPDELTLEEKLGAVDQLGAAGVPFLAIAGGEPLISKDLWPVLERARERRIHVSLATNGTLFDPRQCRAPDLRGREVRCKSAWTALNPRSTTVSGANPARGSGPLRGFETRLLAAYEPDSPRVSRGGTLIESMRRWSSRLPSDAAPSPTSISFPSAAAGRCWRRTSRHRSGSG
jgi:hypothetical protein